MPWHSFHDMQCHQLNTYTTFILNRKFFECSPCTFAESWRESLSTRYDRCQRPASTICSDVTTKFDFPHRQRSLSDSTRSSQKMMMIERATRIPEERNSWDVEASAALLPQNKSPSKKMRHRHMIMTLFGISLGPLCSLACAALTFLVPCNMPLQLATFIINMIAILLTIMCAVLSFLLNGGEQRDQLESSLEPSEVTFLTAFVMSACITQAFLYSTAEATTSTSTWVLLYLMSGPHSVLLLCLWGKVWFDNRQKHSGINT